MYNVGIDDGLLEQVGEVLCAPGGRGPVSLDFGVSKVSVIEVSMQLFPGGDVGAPPGSHFFWLELSACFPEPLVYFASPSSERGYSYEPVGHGAPQEFGGNTLVAAAFEQVVGEFHELSYGEEAFLGRHLGSTASWYANSMVLSANMRASSLYPRSLS